MHRGLSQSPDEMQMPVSATRDTPVVSWSVDKQLHWRHAAALWSVCSQCSCHYGNPKASQPASTPSGVGTCHHGNCFPHLNKGPLEDRRQGWRGWALRAGARPTLARLAVKSTHSNSCPILWRNSSTCGRFSTYTCNGRDSTQVSHSCH